MSPWRKHLFPLTARLSAEPSDYFKLPRQRTISLGSQIEF